jgi:predicted glycoside hydrolase/deacetylase ChbG (UPF0249 family)
MVRYPSVGDAIEYSKKNNLPIGLHIDLGEWILKEYEWTPVYEVVNLDDAAAVKNEIEKQLELFIRLTGNIPTHIDSHQHVHKRENILPYFIDIAKHLNITLRSCNQKVKYCGDFYGQLSNATPAYENISPGNLNKVIDNLLPGFTELACHPGINIEVTTMYKSERDMEVESLCNKSVKESIIKNNVKLCSFTGITFN